ncbi:uncharacterized protein LOC119340135 [Triticum dicoccoides]|uniref:uncharacterized protein LOC119340135 n=1 Tax=Triticum dicoccoides TaxID=85692 RepID=UPI001890EB23|nr:uncharacterized protein LOC119340135 [Triticum dicoccoides]
MGGSMEEQLHMTAAANKIAVPLKKHHPNLHMAHAGAGKGGGEAPAVMVTTPKASSQAPKHAHLLASPGACLCSPTTHAGSFRCRLHRGGAGVGLHEMGKKSSPGA